MCFWLTSSPAIGDAGCDPGTAFARLVEQDAIEAGQPWDRKGRWAGDRAQSETGGANAPPQRVDTSHQHRPFSGAPRATMPSRPR